MSETEEMDENENLHAVSHHEKGGSIHNDGLSQNINRIGEDKGDTQNNITIAHNLQQSAGISGTNPIR